MVIEIYCPFPVFRLCCLKDYSTNPSLQGLNAKLNTYLSNVSCIRMITVEEIHVGSA